MPGKTFRQHSFIGSGAPNQARSKQQLTLVKSDPLSVNGSQPKLLLDMITAFHYCPHDYLQQLSTHRELQTYVQAQGSPNLTLILEASRNHLAFQVSSFPVTKE